MTFNFMGAKKIWLAISLLVTLVGLASLAFRGLNLGIDFTGGSTLELQLQRPVTTSEVRQALDPIGLGDSQVQLTQEGQRQGVFIRTRPLTGQQGEEVIKALRSKLGDFELVQFEEVEGVISRELIRNAFWALAIAAVGMVVYITLRFEFKFAVAGVVAILHDVLITVGLYSLLGREVSSPFVAVVLTIVGYSINDTIVVYDRIRENLKQRRKENLEQLVNRSINETFARSVNTVLTTLLAIVAVFLFGGPTTKNFALALMIGITSGAYSSIFIASALWLMWKEWEEKRRRIPARVAR